MDPPPALQMKDLVNYDDEPCITVYIYIYINPLLPNNSNTECIKRYLLNRHLTHLYTLHIKKKLKMQHPFHITVS